MTQDQLEQGLIETRALCQQNAVQIGELSVALKDVANKLEARRGINWTAVGLLIPAIGGAWVLVNTQINAVRDVVGSTETRVQRTENVSDRDREAKARMWDDFVFLKLTKNE